MELLQWGMSVVVGMGILYFAHRILSASYATSAVGGFVVGALFFSTSHALPGYIMLGYTLGLGAGIISSRCSDKRCISLHPEREEAEC